MSPPTNPAQADVGNKSIKNAIAAAALVVVGALGGVGGFKVYISDATPDDVIAEFPELNRRLAAIERALKPEAVRPDPWTGADAARANARLRAELNDFHVMLKRIDATLDKLTEHAVSHELEHKRQDFRERRVPPTPYNENP